MNQSRRRKNKERMTITEQLQAVALKMCNDYCKHHETLQRLLSEGKAEEYQKLSQELCKDCPFLEL